MNSDVRRNKWEREEVVEKITDESFLIDLILNDLDNNVRIKAFEKIINILRNLK